MAKHVRYNNFEDLLKANPKISWGRCKSVKENQQFEHLTILYRTNNSSSNQTRVACKCNCGKYLVVQAGNIIANPKLSCGCSQIKDLINQKFGELTVIESTLERDFERSVIWNCRCSCGRFKKISSRDLTSGNIKSCGECGYKERKTSETFFKDLTGKQFGYLKAIKPIKKDYDSHYYWLCECQNCGGKIEVSISNLNSGATKSDGCIKSFGEEKISRILSSYNINFIKQKVDYNCIFDSGKYGIFDFYVDNKYYIEYDGIQHFKSKSEKGWNNNQNLQDVIKRDTVKNQYCLDNNIPLIRIPYTQYNFLTIEDLLLDKTNFLIKKE